MHDNADSNIATLDGKGTFHSLGSIQIITPSKGVKPREPFSRLQTISEANVVDHAKLPIES